VKKRSACQKVMWRAGS